MILVLLENLRSSAPGVKSNMLHNKISELVSSSVCVCVCVCAFNNQLSYTKMLQVNISNLMK